MPVKRIFNLIIVTAFLFLSISPVPGFAFNVNVVQGNATVSTSGNTVTINASSRAILQGNTSIPANVTVKVVQGLNDILLRDTTGSSTNILGSLLSNGNIILINPIGVYIGQSANINVGGLIASTLDIKNAMFMNGNYQFTKVPGLNPAQILNDANIKVANGGYVVLLADSIVNKGTITAYMGTVALGSGQQATVSFDQSGLVNLVVDQGLAKQLTDSNGQPKAQIVNSGGIYANGGKVQMSAPLLNTALNQVINNTGIIEANNVVEHGGLVELTASGAIDNSGIIQAGTMNEQGETLNSSGLLDIGHGFFSNLDGAINISGSISGLYSDTGNIDFTGAVSLTGDSTLQADDTGSQTGEVVMNTYSLTGNNFNLTLYTGVNDTLDGSITGVNLLTLNSSTSNNKTFTSTGASFSVNTLKTNYYSLFSRLQGSGTSMSPYMIYSDSNVQGGLEYITTESLSAYYELANNIDATETSSWNSGAGFVPIGTLGSPFTGNFNGNNYTISNLFIDLPATDFVGLFGHTTGATISNIGLTNANVTGYLVVGGLVGNIDNPTTPSTISNSYVTGSVTGGEYVGGLVGESDYSDISDSYATASVSGTYGYVGGLVGNNNSASISSSYATGSVSGGGPTGGLVGANEYSASISDSNATGSVTQTSGSSNAGGLAGFNISSSSISDSYATGSVTSTGTDLGGLVGYNSSSTISKSYATGSVAGGSSSGYTGGLVGENDSGIISDTFAMGALTGGGPMGGLVGKNNGGTISNSYAAGSLTEASGSGNAGGLVGINVSSSSVINSFATGSVSSSGSDIGGLIGYDDGSTTLTNNWWYNSLSSGIGSSGSPTSSGHWQKASGVSDFFSSSQAVYTGTGPWDISSSTGHTWAMSGDDDAFPLLQFRYSTTISDDYQLQLMFLDLGASYSLANNIDASETSNWNSGGGFAPIGISSPFTGTFNGNNYVISNLFINLPSISDVGLFGYTSGSTISNVGLTNTNITGQGNVGGLVGWNDSSSTIANSYTTGSVTGNGGNDIGELVGLSESSSSISNSYATGSVTGNGSSSNVGGLVGLNYFSSSVSNSYATGSVTGDGAVGGLVGDNAISSISNSYSTGSVTGNVSIGGLVGENVISSISNSYSTGSVTGISSIGGLVGENATTSSISNSYATGTVMGSGSNIGGLIGYDDGSNTLTNNWWYNSLSYGVGSSGSPTSTGQWQEAGGVSDFYSSSQAVYTGSSPWDFTSVWYSPSGTYPQLR